MSGMEVVPLEQAWIPQLMEIEREAFGGDAWSEEAFRSGIAQPCARYVSICEGETLYGYMGFLHVMDEIELLTLAAQKQMRRMGMGRRLMDYLLNYARQNNVARVFLEVRASNQAALALYEAVGFHRIGLRKGYYRKPKEDALLYVWTGEETIASDPSI